MNKLQRNILALVIPVILLAVWIIFYIINKGKTSYIISPMEILTGLLCQSDIILINAVKSLARLSGGIILGGVTGCIAAFLMGQNPHIRILLLPTIKIISALPFVAIIPFFLIFFGFGEIFIYSVVSTMAFSIVAPQVLSAILNLPMQYMELAALHQKSLFCIVLKIIYPAALPSFIRSIKLSFLFGWLAIMLAEYAVGELDNGLGHYIMSARTDKGNFNMMFTGIAALVLLAFIIDFVLSIFERKASAWEKSIAQNELSGIRKI